MRWLTETPFLVFDVETTGLDHDTDEVVQLATVAVDRGEIVDEWCTLVRPSKPIPAEASAIHGITDERVAGAPTFADLAPELARRARGRTLLGYNAAHFDAPFLRAALRRLGRPVRDTVPVDPLVWVRQIDRYVKGPGRHKLEATCRRWGVELDGAAHDALVDCRATWHLLVALVERNPARFPDTLAEVLDEQVSMAADQERDFQAFKARAAR